MQQTFPRAMAAVLVHEGGNVDDPRDPGGRTSQGVTQAVYDRFRRARNLPLRDVFAIEPAEREAIYRRDYWQVVRADDLPAGVDYATFDAAVNSGPARGAKWLQRAAGATVDGSVGPETIAAAGSKPATAIVKALCALRLSFVQGLKTFVTFGRGWARRIAEVEALGVKIALEAGALSPAAVETRLEDERAEAEAAKRKQNGNALGAGTGGALDVGAQTADPGQLHPAAPGLLILVLIGLGVALAVFLVRAHIHRQRARAYAAAAAQGARE